MGTTMEQSAIPSSTTFDDQPTQMGAYVIDPNQVVLVELNVIAVSNTGKAAWWGIRGLIKRGTGALSAVGQKEKIERKDAEATAWDCDFSFSGDSVLIQVTGAAGVPISWAVKGGFFGTNPPT